MSELFKRNICIYIYIFMLCFVTGQNNEDIEMIMTYGDIQIHFTLYSNNEVTKFFYEKSKAEGEFVLSIFKLAQEIDFDNNDDFSADDFDKDKFSFEEKEYKNGDLILDPDSYSSAYLFFLGSSQTCNAQKVGEVEKSSIKSFESLFNMLTDSARVDAKFSMKEPEEPIQPKFSPEVTYFVAAVAVVAGIIFFAIIGFFYFFYYL